MATMRNIRFRFPGVLRRDFQPIFAASTNALTGARNGANPNTLTLAVKVDRSFDLLKFILNESVLLISIRVVVGKCLQSLRIFSLRNKPTGALGGEQDKEELKC